MVDFKSLDINNYHVNLVADVFDDVLARVILAINWLSCDYEEKLVSIQNGLGLFLIKDPYNATG